MTVLEMLQLILEQTQEQTAVLEQLHTDLVGVNDNLNKILTALTPQLARVEIKFGQPIHN